MKQEAPAVRARPRLPRHLVHAFEDRSIPAPRVAQLFRRAIGSRVTTEEVVMGRDRWPRMRVGELMPAEVLFLWTAADPQVAAYSRHNARVRRALGTLGVTP